MGINLADDFGFRLAVPKVRIQYKRLELRRMDKPQHAIFHGGSAAIDVILGLAGRRIT